MKEKENVEKQLKQVINGLSEGFKKQVITDNQNLCEDLEKQFDILGIKNFIYQYADSRLDNYMFLLGEIIGKGITSKNRWVLSYYVDGEFKRFIRLYIVAKEGGCCSGDKESFIFSTCYQAIKQDKNISLYDEYKDEKRQAYWSPKSFKDTNEVFEKFEKYLKVCKKIVKHI